jgi:hypothetical protein
LEPGAKMWDVGTRDDEPIVDDDDNTLVGNDDVAGALAVRPRGAPFVMGVGADTIGGSGNGNINGWIVDAVGERRRPRTGAARRI